MSAQAMAAVMDAHFIDITVTAPDKIGRCVCGQWSGTVMDISWDEHLADALTAAGYGRLVKEAETVEELDALPAGSIILDIDGDPWKKRPDGQWLGFLSVEESKTLFWGHLEIRPLVLHKATP